MSETVPIRRKTNQPEAKPKRPRGVAPPQQQRVPMWRRLLLGEWD